MNDSLEERRWMWLSCGHSDPILHEQPRLRCMDLCLRSVPGLVANDCSRFLHVATKGGQKVNSAQAPSAFDASHQPSTCVAMAFVWHVYLTELILGNLLLCWVSNKEGYAPRFWKLRSRCTISATLPRACLASALMTRIRHMCRSVPHFARVL